ncbi:hypothetical protein [Vibrio hepatarius]|uniref:Insecticidal crystal toxin domain-containing protein n=1 Tax=Vibrio hepatarius TaxID=171383 RepID=A0A0M0HW90_9VIBR|nr:hypothetical protein [Vibrio hepatarius]KOO06351.1 hypothetical protein AKJ31_17810 [Vibrio hepatarius]
MKIRKVKIQVRSGGKVGWVNDQYFSKQRSHYVLADYYSEYLWFNLGDGEHAFVNCQTGRFLCSTFVAGSSISLSGFTDKKSSTPNHVSKMFRDRKSDSFHYPYFYCDDLEVDKWVILKDGVKRMTFTLLTPTPKYHPDNAVFHCFGGPESSEPNEFKLIPIEPYVDIVEQKPAYKPDNYDFPESLKMRNYDHMPEGKSEERLVASTVIPCFYINEASPQWQIENSPYYLLQRYQYWERQNMTAWGAEEQIDITITVSVKGTLTKEIEESTNLTIKKDLGVKIEFSPSKQLKYTLTDNYSRTLENSNTLKITEETENFRKREITSKRKYEANTKLATWMLVNKYVVVNGKNSIITQWNVVDTSKRQEDKYPVDAQELSQKIISNCDAEVTVKDFTEDGEITFEIYCDSSDYHRGNFDYKVELYDVFNDEIEDWSFGSYWPSSAGENPLEVADKPSIPENWIVVNVVVESVDCEDLSR